jgi:hypothetical protein
MMGTLTETFIKISISNLSFVKLFKFKFGRNDDSLSINAMSQVTYESDWTSDEYIANTFIKDNKIHISINPEESLTDKNYKVIYLLYSNLISGEVNRLAGVLDISSINLSENKNLINLNIPFKSDVILEGSDSGLHFQTNKIQSMNIFGSNENHSLQKIQYIKSINNKLTSLDPYLSDSTIKHYGIKIN